MFNTEPADGGKIPALGTGLAALKSDRESVVPGQLRQRLAPFGPPNDRFDNPKLRRTEREPEREHGPIGGRSDARGALYFLWVVPYGVATVVIGLAYLKFVWALPKRTRLHFIMAGVIFLTGALGVEMLGAREADLYGYDTVIYCFLYSVEEMLEMLGVVLFIYALLSYLAQLQGGAGRGVDPISWNESTR